MTEFTYDSETTCVAKEIRIGDFIIEKGLGKSVLACKVNGRIVPSDYILQHKD